tara:strand:+ start:61 stop:330 length:270 start_codon:yes stop_codon:yes gene_type:complete
MTETVEDLSNSLLSIEDVTTRYVDPNHWNYTEDQKAIKKKAMKAMQVDYPQLPPLWIENIYDLIMSKTDEEVEAIKKSKSWEQPAKKRI